MRLNEVLLLIREAPAAIVTALDALLMSHGRLRVAARDIHQDFTPLLSAGGDDVAFVLSQPKNGWVACFASLGADALWTAAEDLSRALEQPVFFVLVAGDEGLVAYRFFNEGELREELLPAELRGQAAPGENDLLAVLERHGVPRELVYDRRDHFGEEHLALAYA